MAQRLKDIRRKLESARTREGRLSEDLRAQREVLKLQMPDAEKKSDFTCMVEKQTEPTQPGKYTTDCRTCNMTSQENCDIPNDKNKSKYMTDLGNVQPQNLVLTAEILEERYGLEITTNAIEENIKMGLKKQEQLKTEQNLLKRHESDLPKNRKFSYEVEELCKGPVQLPKGQYAVNCSHCQITCHQRCTRKFVYLCNTMTKMGYCRVCPQRCSSSKHEFKVFKYQVRMVRVTKTSEELKRRYEEAAGKKLMTEQLIAKCQKEIEDRQRHWSSLNKRGNVWPDLMR